MEEDIVSKINKEVRSGLRTEKDVIYFFVESRKLLDRQGNKTSFLTLRFYSNWVVHHEIGDLKEFETLFLELNTLVDSYINNPNTNIRHKINSLISSFLSFSELRKDIQKFIQEQGILSDFVDQDARWAEFCKHLKEIILDCPLDLSKIRKIIPSSKLARFRITRDNIFQLPEGLNYLPWEIWIITSSMPMTGFIGE